MAANGADAGGVQMQRTLSLTGVTVNAMALIAPGAFLWTTLQAPALPITMLRRRSSGTSGTSTSRV